MRQLLTILLLIGMQNAYAFQDRATKIETQNLIENMKNETQDQRLAQLEKYKDFLYERLNTLDVPDIETASDEDPRTEDPRIKEYRSLTEFDGYINLITMEKITKVSCEKMKIHIISSASIDDTVVEEAAEALNVLAAMCQ